MNRHEFEARTGWEVSDDDYAQIEKIYMNAGEMDKDEFCRDYAKGNGHEIMNYLSQKADDQRNHIRKLDKKIARLEEECGEMRFNFSAEQSSIYFANVTWHSRWMTLSRHG